MKKKESDKPLFVCYSHHRYIISITYLVLGRMLNLSYYLSQTSTIRLLFCLSSFLMVQNNYQPSGSCIVQGVYFVEDNTDDCLMTFSTMSLHKDKETIILYELPLITCAKILLLSSCSLSKQTFSIIHSIAGNFLFY